MLPEYPHTKSERLAQISTPSAEIQKCFLGDCFLLVHPCRRRRTLDAGVTTVCTKLF